MKKRKISLPLVLGGALILCSLCLVVFFQIRVHTGYRKNQQAVTQIRALLPEKTLGVAGTNPEISMPVLEIGGKDYAAILEIPAYGITLPVADRWDTKALVSVPARFSGSVYDGSLVIGGNDHARQFAFCDKIENGTLVTVTDMTGAQFTYAVSRVDRAKHAKAQWLQEENADLTLFCRDMYTMEYVAARCVSTAAYVSPYGAVEKE